MSEEYPLFPTLTDQGKKEADDLEEAFRQKIHIIIKQEVEEVLRSLHCDVTPYIETDSWTNFRNEMMEGFKDYNNRRIQGEYDFKDIRHKIYKDYREDIIKDLNQDMLKEIESLKEQVEWERRCHH